MIKKIDLDIPVRIKIIQQRIRDLVREYWYLVNPTDEEVRDAQENLTEDPMNSLPEIVGIRGVVSDQLILDEVVATREMREEHETNASKRLGPKTTKMASPRKSKVRRDKSSKRGQSSRIS